MRVQLEGEFHVLEAGLVLDELDGLADHGVEIAVGHLRLFFTGEVQQPADDPGAALGFADDDVHVLGLGAALGQIGAHQVRKGQYARQRVVDLVGDARGEQADRGQLLGLDRLGFGKAQLAGFFLDLPFQRVRPLGEIVFGALQRQRHEVERLGEVTDLVGASHRDQARAVPGGDEAGAGLEVAEGLVDQAVDQPA